MRERTINGQQRELRHGLYRARRIDAEPITRSGSYKKTRKRRSGTNAMSPLKIKEN